MRKQTRLKFAIFEEGLTQKEVARRAGLDPAIISLIINGRYVPDSIQRAKIVKVLNKNESELFED